MSEDRNSYRSITKSIGIFGGTKILQILMGVIKNKIVAVLLGPVGMGIQGMLTSTTGLVGSLTNLGLHTSAVRDVAQAYSSGDNHRVNVTVTILRRLVIITGLLGALLTFIFAKQLSVLSFGTVDYTLSFRILSITLFFNQISIGQTVLLQGTFHYRYMATSSLWGSFLGLLLCVPIFYFWGEKGIVPVIILSSLTAMLLTTYYSRKVPYKRQKLSLKETFVKGKVMIILGLALALSGVLNMGSVYAVRAFLSNSGTIAAVGLYTAGMGIVTEYVNVVLMAMGSDYSPRLAAAADDSFLFVSIMNRQAVLLVTIIAPLALLFVTFASELIVLLYSQKFLMIVGMVEWIMLGMLFRCISWSISYGFAAKGEAKYFFVNELISTAYSVAFAIIGFKIYSYDGIGIGFFFSNLLYVVQVFFIGRHLFNFKFSEDAKKKCFPMILMSVFMVMILKLFSLHWLKLVAGLCFTVAIVIISYKWLDQMIGIKSILCSLSDKVKRKK